MKYKKLEAKKLPAPKQRSMDVLIHIQRQGAGAGHHKDKSKYSRKPKHKQRYNPALPEAKIKDRVKEAYSARVRPALEGMLKALDDAGFKSLRPQYVAFSANVMDLNRLMALSSIPYYAEEVRLHEPSALVIAETLGFRPGGPWAPVMENEEAAKVAAPFIATLARDLESMRAPAFAQLAEMKGGFGDGDSEEDMDDEFENFLSGKDGSVKVEEDEEFEPAPAPRPAPPRPAGVHVSPEMKARLEALRKAVPAEVEEEEEETETRRTGSGRTKVEKVVEKIIVPESRGELETAPYLQYIAKSRSSVRPPADMLAQVKDDVLLYALQDHTTQTYMKGSLTQTFTGSQGRSSVKIAASYADAWRREGKKSRLSARIFVAVQGDDQLILKSPALDAVTGKAATPVTIEEIKKQLKIEALSNPRRHNPARREAKYADVKARYGARGFAFPAKAPYVGSFPVYPIGRARYALAIVAAPAYDHKQADREKVIAAVKAAYPKDRSILAEIATVRARAASRMRAVANPRRRRNGPTADMPYYPRTEKESVYSVLSDKELRGSLKDAKEALKVAVGNAAKGKGFPAAPKWYADDVQTILAEMNRRGIR